MSGEEQNAGVTRYCQDCDDETPHRQQGESWECLACFERIEVEAALGIGSGRDD